MSKKNIYIHIGRPKTGSKTIQFGLAENSAQLKKNGFWCANAGDKNHKGEFIPNLNAIAHQIINDVLDEKRFNGILDDVRNAKEQNIILSSEVFGTFDPKKIIEFAEPVAPLGNIKIIVYLRRPDLWFVSRWSQNTKTGRKTKDFTEYLSEVLPRETYDKKLNIWAEAFGKENIIVKVLEKSQIEGHLFHDFLRTCGIQNVDDFSIPSSSNISPTIKELAILRYLFSQIDLPTYYKEVPPNFFASKLKNFANDHGWDGRRPNIIDKDTYKWIDEVTGPSYTNIANTFLNREKLFFEEFEEKPITHYDISELSGEEASEIMAFLISELLNYLSSKK